MASHGALCESCMLVPLDPRQLSEAKTRARGLFPRWPLGTAGRARASNCRFCQFVSAALYHYGRLRRIPPVAQDHEIELSWRNRFDIYSSFFLAAGTRNNPASLLTEFQLCFVRDPDSVDADDPTTYLTPDKGQKVNFRRVYGWIESCQRGHGRICNGGDTLTVGGREVSDGPNQIGDKYPGLRILRLIDVHDNCIIATVENVKYVALSYLWGLAVNFRLTTANYQDLVDRPGSLARYWSSLPRTIQDAVTFVRDMGERYLWCDALCLVQNNPQDVRSGLDVMDYIYERALFTIVGACGHDADAGLPGVLPGSRMCSTGIGDEIVPGVTLGLDIALDLCLRSSAYISRGWTFQEEMLSRRIVYFVDNKVYFRCRSSIEFEHGDPRPDGQLVFRKQQLYQIPAYSHILLVNPVRDFAEMVGLYSKRALTYQADALNAMRGIVRRVSDKMKCAFFEGIPTAAFDVFIIFRRSFGSQLRRRAAFPSYSWTGWMGALTIIQQDYGINPAQTLNDWLKTKTWIIWYTRSPDGSCALLWGPDAHHDFPWQDPSYVGYRTRSEFYLPDNPHLFILTDQTIPTAKFGQDKAVTDAPIRDYPLLQFWTLSVFFQLKDIDTQHATAHVWDPVKNGVCGYLYLDGLGDTQFYEAASDRNASTGSPRSFEMILLSSANVQTWWADAISRGERMGERFPLGPAYTAMVLEWMGNVAERRGLGLLLRSAVVHSLAPGPVWKEILLG